MGKQRSLTVTVISIAGVLLALLGAIGIAFGVFGDTEFGLQLGAEYKLNATSTGLVILVFGVALVYIAYIFAKETGVVPFSKK
jgi:hypothetical protein